MQRNNEWENPIKERDPASQLLKDTTSHLYAIRSPILADILLTGAVPFSILTPSGKSHWLRGVVVMGGWPSDLQIENGSIYHNAGGIYIPLHFRSDLQFNITHHLLRVGDDTPEVIMKNRKIFDPTSVEAGLVTHYPSGETGSYSNHIFSTAVTRIPKELTSDYQRVSMPEATLLVSTGTAAGMLSNFNVPPAFNYAFASRVASI